MKKPKKISEMTLAEVMAEIDKVQNSSKETQKELDENNQRIKELLANDKT